MKMFILSDEGNPLLVCRGVGVCDECFYVKVRFFDAVLWISLNSITIFEAIYRKNGLTAYGIC